MILSSDILSDNRLPDIIRDHKVFKENDKFEKVFPHIGLKNFKTPVAKMGGFPPFIWKQIDILSKILKSENIDNKDPIVLNCLKNTFISTFSVYAIFANVIPETFKSIKRFKKCDVVFSSDGLEGIWDIATMSMRGTSSCMSWGSGKSKHLVGSIIDPCCGIIYLTDNEEKTFGKNILDRAVVRYVITPALGEALFLEKIYSQTTRDNAYANSLDFIFGLSLFKKTGLPVIVPEDELHSFIPLSSIVDCNMNVASYRDSGLKYKKIDANLIKQFPRLAKLKNNPMLGF